MKLICIIGSSVQKTLLPLLHYQEQFSSVVCITPKRELETVKYIRTFLDERRHDLYQKYSFSLELVQVSPEYDDFYETVYAILWETFVANEESILNVSGGTANMILAGIQAARAMRTPVMYADSNKLNIQTIRWSDDGKHTEIQRDYIDLKAFHVRDFLALCNFYPSYLIPDESLPGIQYERWVYSFFQSASETGTFDSIDRNIILTWNRDTKKRNEIDIVFIRNRTFGFVSVKSGKTVDAKSNFSKTSKELKKIYPEWLMRLPCMKILISKYGISERKKNELADKGILIFDDVIEDADVLKAINKIIAKVDGFTASDQLLEEETFDEFSEFADGNEFF